MTTRIETTARHTVTQLQILEQTFGQKAAMEMVEGMGVGIKDYLISKYGRRATYDLMAGFVDEAVLNADLPVGR